MDRPRFAVIGAIIAAVTFTTWPAASFATAPGTRSDAAHFELRTSAPQADSTVAPTDEVRLWFTQEPQDGTTQIRVMQGDERVPTGDAQMDPDDATSYFVQQDMPLTAGDYRVLWRSMAPDGHVVNGEFGFTIAEAGGGR
ncbi:MAG TPA: copper resistance CopC family protein [Longimicrobiales bacterium]|nr:copper resistance CopC family protein [Longimicrobiales bacterium]